MNGSHATPQPVDDNDEVKWVVVVENLNFVDILIKKITKWEKSFSIFSCGMGGLKFYLDKCKLGRVFRNFKFCAKCLY